MDLTKLKPKNKMEKIYRTFCNEEITDVIENPSNVKFNSDLTKYDNYNFIRRDVD